MRRTRIDALVFAACLMITTAASHAAPASAPASVSARAAIPPAPQCSQQPLAQRLADAARAAPSSVQADGSLYGMQRWHDTTGKSYFGMKFPGLLSCAYTVSAIFKAACHPIGARASVSSVDTVLSSWKKIQNPKDLKPGDVVFWRPRPGRILGVRCPTTHWHVGISTGGDHTVDNDWWSGKPVNNTLSRVCVTFAYARRPPDSRG